jgi:hypothetical protein
MYDKDIHYIVEVAKMINNEDYYKICNLCEGAPAVYDKTLCNYCLNKENVT